MLMVLVFLPSTMICISFLTSRHKWNSRICSRPSLSKSRQEWMVGPIRAFVLAVVVCSFLWFWVSAEVLMFDGMIVLYKVINDAIFYVISTDKENELIMQAVLSALEESMSNLLR
eukprot:TRINITY_DN2685_c0_g1_i2.p1 TRINITY_DN2685_c0_g1~~TRINITY_DN2685_c0_g1_i2.p1  ORF type:complete len:115 (-),score=26.87 TRINITY_DN2685_c0_g1_i2:66-410(-)